MVTQISGNAVVPDFYISEDGHIVRLRPEDLIKAVENSAGFPVTYVDEHKDNGTGDIKGVVTKLDSDGSGVFFNAVLTDEELEENIRNKYDSGEIPNVSIRIKPTPTASYTPQISKDGHSYVVADDWEIKHISNTSVGRCKPENGCGVFDYTITNTANTTGINETPTTTGVDYFGGYVQDDYIYYTEIDYTGESDMEEEPCIKTELAEAKAEVESLSLKLSELKETNSELESQIAELRKEKEGMELVLSETKENLEILAKREYDEEVDLILSLDSEYPLKGDETMDELELILTALRRSSERRKSLVGDKNKEDMTATSVVNELKELTGRIR